MSSLAPPPNPYPASMLLSWLVTPIHAILFFTILCAFHPLLMISRLFGLRAHDFFYKGMCYSLMLNIQLTGTKLTFHRVGKIPQDRSIIFVSNHQCMYDVPYIIWFMREYDPKFISKVELARWIPGISFALRNGGHLLINRKDARSSLLAIEAFGKEMETGRRSIAIFPEGTRAKDGVLKRFKPGGLATLLKVAPSALIVPIAIDGSWEHTRFKFRPVPVGLSVEVHALEPIEQNGRSAQEIIDLTERAIAQKLTAIRTGSGPLSVTPSTDLS